MTTAPPVTAFNDSELPAPDGSPRRLALLEQALRTQHFLADDLVVLSLRAPLAPPERLLEECQSHALVFWAEPDGQESVGIGVAGEVSARGIERFEQIRLNAEALWKRLRYLVPPQPHGVRVFGGFSFQVGRAEGPLWSDFGEAHFVLPRLSYARDGVRASLTLIVSGAELAQATGATQALRELAEALARLSTEQPASTLAPSETRTDPGQPLSLDDAFEGSERAARARWTNHVNAVRANIAEGRFSKVVVARRAVLESTRLPTLQAVLSHLREEAPGCTRFLFRRGSKHFVGATPERLIRKNGTVIETEALAGSIRPGGRTSIDALLNSKKDLEEHAIVVRALVGALQGDLSELSYSETPRVRELRHILHLWTRIRGRLRQQTHVLDLVRRLHPTPAVGGDPTPEALEWIRCHEDDERGWYAAPIGWFDPEGDGDFLVALRSALLEQDRAHLYVGSGIVSDSDPEAEFAETRLKLTGIARALGAKM